MGKLLDLAKSGTSLPLSPAAFVAGLAARGLSLSLSEDGEALLLAGPKAARTEKIRRYIAVNKTLLLVFLRNDPAAQAAPAPVLAETERSSVGQGADLTLPDPFEGTEPPRRHCPAESVPLPPCSPGDTDFPAYEPDSREAIEALRAAAFSDALPPRRIALPGVDRHTDDPNAYARQLIEQYQAGRAASDRPAYSRAADELNRLAAWWHAIEQEIGPGLPGAPPPIWTTQAEHDALPAAVRCRPTLAPDEQQQDGVEI